MDVSMMERLIINNQPHVVLKRQSRMHPDIAKYIRCTMYPELTDNYAVVSKHAQVDVLNSRTFFWNCDAEESTQAGSTSPTNEEEANRVVRLSLYLVGQGIDPK